MFSVVLAYVLTLVLVQQAQTYLIPVRLRPSKRNLNLWLIQTALITLIFTSALLISYRPFLSSIISLAICAVFLVVNQAKYKALDEPLVFSDIYLYLQVFTHPRLFLPFLNFPLTIFAITLGLGLLSTAIILEPALSVSKIIFSSITILLILILGIFILKQAIKIQLSFEPIADVKNLGFLNSLAIYFIQAKQSKNLANFKAITQTQTNFIQNTSTIAIQPDLVVVQSESFFDPRCLSTSINPSVLKHFDLLSSQAQQTGKLHVPAWGANTLRSEYAFLSGLPNQQLQHYRFNPYQFLQKNNTLSIVSYLKKLGYRCICIHPNHSIFFKRDKVFPLLGFDEFIDLQAFDAEQTAGPYISDQAVASKIQEILETHEGKCPLFIFAITMENHGPLHLETYVDADLNELYQKQPPKQHHDLTIYLKHLKNADQMLLTLTDYFKLRANNTWLCWYGDHVPSMPKVYKELNFKDGRSEYLIWNNQIQTPISINKELPIEQLGIAFLELAGLSVADEG